MKKSLIYITAGIAAVGFAVPAFAAHGDTPEHIVPTQVTVASSTPTTATSNTVASADDNATKTSVDDNATTNSVDDNATTNSVDDNATTNSVDDNVTTNSVEDVSGPCDEAEHATDPSCAAAGATATPDDSAHDATDDNSSHSGGSDDSGHGSNDG